MKLKYDTHLNVKEGELPYQAVFDPTITPIQSIGADDQAEEIIELKPQHKIKVKRRCNSMALEKDELPE